MVLNITTITNVVVVAVMDDMVCAIALTAVAAIILMAAVRHSTAGQDLSNRHHEKRSMLSPVQAELRLSKFLALGRHGLVASQHELHCQLGSPWPMT